MCGIIQTMEKLTTKQEKVLTFIQEIVEQNLPPTIREIAQELGFSSTGTVRDYLKALEKKGYLKRGLNKSRSIELLDLGSKAAGTRFPGIPIIAHINAGRPDFAYEDILGYVNPDELFLGRLQENDIFALKVKGLSMIDAGILDGDIAIIKKQQTAQNGDIIAALLENNEVTLKRFKNKENKKIFLEAANKEFSPILKPFAVIGRLITVVRKYS